MTKKKAIAKKKAPGGGKTAKKTVRKAAPKAKLPMDAMTPAAQKAAFRAAEKAIRDAGVSGTLTALHFESNDLGLICPPGTRRQMVCRRDATGVVVCQPVCVPRT